MSRSAKQIGIKARFVFPVDRPPLRDAVLLVRDHRIVSITAPGDCFTDCIDLGDSAIIPPLVNAHTHLQLSGLNTPLGLPGIPFEDWLRLVLDHRANGQAQGPSAIRSGRAESRRCGVSHLGDITSDPDTDLTEYEPQSAVFLELMDRPAWSSLESALTSARRYLRRRPALDVVPGLSPHAPYTASVELASGAAHLAQSLAAPLAMHLAETQQEIEYLHGSRNGLTALLAERGVSPLGSPATIGEYLAACEVAPQLMVVHGNYLAAADWRWIAQRHGRVCVAYCPRTHAYFGHPHYPLRDALKLGARMVIGTDSRASSPDLDLWSEVQFAAELHPEVARQDLLRMITTNAAEALMLKPGTGTLSIGGQARFNVVTLKNLETDDPHDQLFGGTTITSHQADYLV